LWTIESGGQFISLNGGYEDDIAKFAAVIETSLD
jgi:hypothetical protein